MKLKSRPKMILLCQFAVLAGLSCSKRDDDPPGESQGDIRLRAAPREAPGIEMSRGVHADESGEAEDRRRLEHIRYLKECDMETLFRELVEFGGKEQPIRLEGLLSLINHRITDEDFPKYWGLLAGIKDQRDIVTVLQRQAIEKFAANGNADAAFSLVMEGSGPGQTRNVLLQTLFSTIAGDHWKTAELFAKLQSNAERANASRGLADAIARSPNLSGVGSLLTGWDGVLAEGAVGGLGLYVMHNPDSDPHFDVGSRLTEVLGVLQGLDETARKKALSKIISNIGRADTGKVIAALEKGQGGDFQWEAHLDGAAIQALATGLARRSPENAVTKFADGKSAAGFSAAYHEWLKIDKNQAVAWLDENKASLDEAIGGHAYAALGQGAARDKDFVEAWRRVNEIKDPELKRRTEGQVWTSERDFVRKEVEANPVRVVDAMVKGQSAHQPYWLEEAMVTWVAKDSDQAEAWYRSNWNLMPPEKAQYVAAAFASHSSRLGDPVAARQWADHIVDEKIRQRIGRAIAEREVQPAE